jgi:hypothetical protein
MYRNESLGENAILREEFHWSFRGFPNTFVNFSNLLCNMHMKWELIHVSVFGQGFEPPRRNCTHGMSRYSDTDHGIPGVFRP